MQRFLDEHRFAQRRLSDGSELPVSFTHQPLDMIHEEMIRLELMCLDKNRLRRNAETGRMERDPVVFQQAARWLDFFGEDFVKSSTWDRANRKYDKYYKKVLLIRSQLRKSGFLADYGNARLPFFSFDLKSEMHPELHNFKHFGEANFSASLNHLQEGKSYTSLSCVVQPKTVAEEEKLLKRNALSKEELHKEAMEKIEIALMEREDDVFLRSYLDELQSKKASSFKLKQELIEYVAKVDQYIGDLQLEKNIREVLVANDDGDEEEYVL